MKKINGSLSLLIFFLWSGVSPILLAGVVQGERFLDFFPSYPKIEVGTGAQASLVTRGEYLTKMGDCIACHTENNGGVPFSGGYALKTPFGVLYSPNITPNKRYGLGQWHFEDFKHAMRQGVNPKGGRYYPAFPYVNYTLLSDQDLRAIWAYLKKIPSIEKPNKPHGIAFPFNLGISRYVWQWLYFRQTGPYEYNHLHTPVWNRGAYLVEGLGHCTMCHTAKNLLGADKSGYHLGGAFVDGFWAPNINTDGLSDNSTEEVLKVFTENRLLNGDKGSVAGPMASVNHDSLRYARRSDLEAIVLYLKSVDADVFDGSLHSVRATYLARGKKVFDKTCALCHATGQLGAPRLRNDGSNWEIRLKKGLPELYRNVMYGFNSMPIKGNCQNCSDEDLRAAVDYVVFNALGARKMKQVLTQTQAREKTDADGKHLYKQVCAQCHDKGILNAPILGDISSWKSIINKNIDVLVKNAIQGNHKKPAMSGCRACTTEDIKAAVKYMVQTSKSKGDYSLW